MNSQLVYGAGPTRRVLADIYSERVRQDARWGDQRGHSSEHWLAILMEEVGEAARSVLDGEPIQRRRAELIQIAAVAAAAVEALDGLLGETDTSDVPRAS